MSVQEELGQMRDAQRPLDGGESGGTVVDFFAAICYTVTDGYLLHTRRCQATRCDRHYTQPLHRR
jgi:hypothetical protein